MLLVRIVRNSQGLTQEDLAQVSGVHHSEISRLENGHVKPSIDRACVLADALGWRGNPFCLFMDVSEL